MIRFVLMSAACSIIAGCAAPVFEDPIAVMVDREASFSQRRAAADQALRQMPSDERRIEALETLLWKRGYPAWQRKYAVDQLLARDEEAFRASLGHRIVLLNDWETLNHIFDLAILNGWNDFTPALVRNYARPAHGMSDLERPERRVLEQLNPGRTVEDVVFEIFADADDQKSIREQVAAWGLLARLVETETLIDMLGRAPSATPLVIDLKAAAAELHVLPLNREDVLWLQYLRDPARADVWCRAAARVGALTAEQRRGLDLRHLPILIDLQLADLALTRSHLLDGVHAEIRAGDRYLVGPTYDGLFEEWPQRFRAWRDRLEWADLVTIRLLMRAVRDRAVVAAVFEQADRDLEDRSTEYGGVLDRKDGAFTAIGFEPLYRKHDLKFIPSDRMVKRLYSSFAHYHFHAQRYENKRYGGPGEGDLKLADRLHFNFLVFTFIDRDRLNVDYYQRGRIVIDLGTIHR